MVVYIFVFFLFVASFRWVFLGTGLLFFSFFSTLHFVEKMGFFSCSFFSFLLGLNCKYSGTFM